MDQVLNQVGSYSFSKKANKEIDSVSDDTNSLSTSIEGEAKWDFLLVMLYIAYYEFNEETQKLTVYIPTVCEVGYRDSSVLLFFTIVTGYLEKGKLVDIEGMKTKVIIWVKVTCISYDGSKLHFIAGMSKTRSRYVQLQCFTAWHKLQMEEIQKGNERNFEVDLADEKSDY
ncbi:hypothetical protein CJ030_MR3G015843 [Morella rubra]|uniref:Uncharacterized protein n=1 Tax=Morella rubra TaxID=262757 RepID=A0A6A1WCM9_9ROSI|nr:hypothetical protein CJ030_MR3G015843 [Morella rubra]